MEPDNWHHIEHLFHAVAQLSSGERSKFLDEQCGDPIVRKEVESLLAYHSGAHSFIESPAFEQTARALARSEAALPDPLVGQTVSTFRVIEKLGEGGGGKVYKAEDLKLRRFVALKFLPEYLSADAAATDRVEREARAASALNHANVCTIHLAGEHNGRPFIAMELLEGNTLDKEIAKGLLPWPTVAAIAAQLGDALQCAHALGIVHRDIKPANLLLTNRGVLKVLDFGLAKVTHHHLEAVAGVGFPTVDLTVTGAALGTAAYMSPEQARGERLDGRSDLFSTGAVLYEMLTGRRAFPGNTAAVIFEGILNRTPERLRTISPEVPIEFEAIVMRCLEKDPDLRYRQAGELLTDLSAFGGNNGTMPVSQVGQRIVTDKRAPNGDHGLANSTAVEPAEIRLVSRPKHTWLIVLSAMLVAILGVGAYRAFHQPNKPPAEAPLSTIAVLPFKPLVPQSRDEALEMGMADTLISKLSSSKQIIVRPISSVRRYSALEQDPLAAGRELGVQAVLDGTIERVGNRIRVTVRLLSATDSRTLWSGHFDEKFTDIFAMQDTISQRVAGELAPTLTGAEREFLAKRYTADAEAYDFYLKGRYFWNKRTREGTKRAAEYFQQALDHDPTYALAYAGLADCYRTFPIMSDQPAGDAFPKAKQAALKALEIDEKLPEAHTTLGYIKLFYDWDWEGSAKEHERALELNPNYSLAHIGYAHLLSNLGRHDEALREADRAVALDPLSPYIGTLQSMFLYQARRYAESIDHMQKTLDIEPNFWIGQLTLGKDYEREGRYQEALAAFARAEVLSGGTTEAMSLSGYTYATSGNRKEAERIVQALRAMAKDKYVPPYNIAMVYQGLGTPDETIKWLEKGYQEKDVHMVFLLVDPKWDTLRKDPRFVNLVKHLNFNN